RTGGAGGRPRGGGGRAQRSRGRRGRRRDWPQKLFGRAVRGVGGKQSMIRALEWCLGRFSLDLGIDLGTANTLVCVAGQGIVMSEPSVVAVQRGSNRVLLDGNAVGESAKEM